MGIAADLSIIFVVALLFGWLAQELRQPLILGYIVAGIVLGPHTGVLTIAETQQIELLAEIGVALLLFALGMEFSLKELKPVRRIAAIGTPIMIVLTLAFGYGIGIALDWPWIQAVWFGAMISLSSTMVVLKTLMSQGVMGTLSSRVMVGILLAQDLAVVPLLLLLPELEHIGTGGGALVWGLGKAAIFLVAIFALGERLIPILLRRIALWNSRELFVLAVVAIALGIGYATHLFGLSYAFGAFVAGIVLSESDYGHQALGDILPLRDLFGLLFFASVGMLFDPAFLLENFTTVLSIVVLVMVGKAIIIGTTTFAFGYRNIVPLATALALAQIGEFSFLIARAGVATEAVHDSAYALVIATAIVTMMLTPYVARTAAPLYAAYRRRYPGVEVLEMAAVEVDLKDHVIVIGGGRVGRQVAQALKQFDTPFVVIEFDQRRVDQAKEAGWPIIYGDAVHDAVLRAAGVEQARLVLVTVPTAGVARSVIDHIRAINPRVDVVARAEGIEHMRALHEHGVLEVVQPEFEASLEMLHQALLHLGIPPAEIQAFLDAARRELYEPLYNAASRYAEVARIRSAGQLLALKWVSLPPNSPFAGCSIADLGVRKRTGVSIVAVMRNHELKHNPPPDYVLAAGDWLAVIGADDQVAAVAAWAAGEAPV